MRRRDCDVTQFAVLNAGAAQTINNAITTSLTATMTLLKLADSRMPMTSSVIEHDNQHGRNVQDRAGRRPGCCAALYANGETQIATGKFNPKALTRLMK